VRRIVDAAVAAGCAPVVVVVGETRERIADALRGTLVELVDNVAWQRGMGTSIKRGVEHLREAHPATTSVVLLACDQPFVDGSVVAALITEHETSSKPIVASRYADTLGIPALFDRTMFDALLALHDERGAKPLIEANLEGVAAIEFNAGAIDIDTPADVDALKSND
jgi:molybdenum cofactor cytidylyltransferase